jgi:hypothetical protein
MNGIKTRGISMDIYKIHTVTNMLQLLFKYNLSLLRIMLLLNTRSFAAYWDTPTNIFVTANR